MAFSAVALAPGERPWLRQKPQIAGARGYTGSLRGPHSPPALLLPVAGPWENVWLETSLRSPVVEGLRAQSRPEWRPGTGEGKQFRDPPDIRRGPGQSGLWRQGDLSSIPSSFASWLGGLGPGTSLLRASVSSPVWDVFLGVLNRHSYLTAVAWTQSSELCHEEQAALRGREPRLRASLPPFVPQLSPASVGSEEGRAVSPEAAASG